MPCDRPTGLPRAALALGVSLLLCAGCQTIEEKRHPADLPRELAPASLPPYVIEPPDVLVIDAVRLVPKPPYRVAPLDVLAIQVTGNLLPNTTISGLYPVDAEGAVNLGFDYKTVRLEGMTLEEARAAIEKHLKNWLKMPFEVAPVVLGESRAIQQIRGPHLVRPDGTVGLGAYGSVYVDNMTIPEATAAIERHLSALFLKPEISLDVSGFNSKVYYVITDLAGNGESVARLPVTGKTTVLDAVSNVNGISPLGSTHHVYLVRPTECGKKEDEVYPVDWKALAHCGDARTNYQVMPGDRIYVMGAPLIKTYTYLDRVLAIPERIFGVVGLGNLTVREFLTPIPRNVNALNITP
jgi:polysaccharide export outer membrane protein